MLRELSWHKQEHSRLSMRSFRVWIYRMLFLARRVQFPKVNKIRNEHSNLCDKITRRWARLQGYVWCNNDPGNEEPKTEDRICKSRLMPKGSKDDDLLVYVDERRLYQCEASPPLLVQKPKIYRSFVCLLVCRTCGVRTVHKCYSGGRPQTSRGVWYAFSVVPKETAELLQLKKRSLWFWASCWSWESHIKPPTGYFHFISAKRLPYIDLNFVKKGTLQASRVACDPSRTLEYLRKKKIKAKRIYCNGWRFNSVS